MVSMESRMNLIKNTYRELKTRPQTPQMRTRVQGLQNAVSGNRTLASGVNQTGIGYQLSGTGFNSAPPSGGTKKLPGNMSLAKYSSSIARAAKIIRLMLNKKNNEIKSVLNSDATPEAHGANAGKQVARLYENKEYAAIANSDITYMYETDEGNLSVNSGMAYSHESMDPFRDTDGKVSADQFGELGEIIDTDNDGYVSDLENLAYTYFQDATGEGDAGCDGTVTPEEAARGQSVALADSDYAEEKLKEIADFMETKI